MINKNVTFTVTCDVCRKSVIVDYDTQMMANIFKLNQQGWYISLDKSHLAKCPQCKENDKNET